MLIFFLKNLALLVLVQCVTNVDGIIDIEPVQMLSLIKHSMLTNVRTMLQEFCGAQNEGSSNTAPSAVAGGGLISRINNYLIKLFDHKMAFPLEEQQKLVKHLAFLEGIENKFEQKIMMPQNDAKQFVESIAYIAPLMITYDIKAKIDEHRTIFSGEKLSLELEIEICGNSDPNLSQIFDEIKQEFEHRIGAETFFEKILPSSSDGSFLSKCRNFYWKNNDNDAAYDKIRRKIRQLNALIMHTMFYHKFIDTLLHKDKANLFAYELQFLKEMAKQFVDTYFELKDDDHFMESIVIDKHLKGIELVNNGVEQYLDKCNKMMDDLNKNIKKFF